MAHEWVSKIGNTGRPMLVALSRGSGLVPWSELSGPGGVGVPVLRMKLRAGDPGSHITVPLSENDDPDTSEYNARVVFTPEIFATLESGRYVGEIDAHYNGEDFTTPDDGHLSLRFMAGVDPYEPPPGPEDVDPIVTQGAAAGSGSTTTVAAATLTMASVAAGSAASSGLAAGTAVTAGATVGAGAGAGYSAGSVAVSGASAGSGITVSIAAPTAPLAHMSMPGSSLFAMSDHQLDNRAIVSGRLARHWWIMERQIGAPLLIVYRQNGHSANPQDVSNRMSDGALAALVDSATLVEVDLGGVARSSAEVVQLTADAITLAGGTASVYGTVPPGPITAGRSIIEVEALSITIPPSVDMTDLERRGRWGVFRTMFNGVTQDATTMNSGAVQGRYLVHHDAPGAGLGAHGRILGSAIWTGSPDPHRVSIGTGAYTPNPTGVPIIAEQLCTEIGAGALTYCSSMLDDAVVVDDVDGIWQIITPTQGPSASDIGFRVAGNTPAGMGTIVNDGLFQSDAVTFDPIGSSYDPATVIAGAGWSASLIIELEDASGNFPANGELQMVLGAQGVPYMEPGDVPGVDAPQRGNPFPAGYDAFLNSECTIHSTLWPDIEDLYITAVRRAGMRGAPTDGCHPALIGFADENVPGVPMDPAPVVIHDFGWMPITAQNGFNEITFNPPLPCGSDFIDLVATPRVGVGFTYGTASGMVLDVTLDDEAGGSVGLDGWEDSGPNAPHLAGSPYFPDGPTERMNFHDDVIAYNEGRALPSGVSEYAVQDEPTLPLGGLGQAQDPYPAQLHADGSVNGSITNPAALAHDQLVVWSPGFELYSP